MTNASCGEITLGNIKDFTLQQVFDQCVTHLLSQNVKCYDALADTCAFRIIEEDGTVTRCALGCFIPDSVYAKNLEGNDLSWVLKNLLLDPRISTLTFDLLTALQNVHDFSEPEHWGGALELVAEDFDLAFKGA